MKKTLAIALAFGVTSAFAQDLTSKKGEPILPEAGDWSIGVDATPFLNFAGGMLSNAGASAPTWEHYGLNQTIVGKMFKDEKTAYRAILRIGYRKTREKAEVPEFLTSPPAAPTSALAELPENKIDRFDEATRFIGLGAGMEWRRGKTRLQGFYGADLFVWGTSVATKYKYGNDLTQSTSGAQLDANNGTYVTDFGSNIVTAIPGYTNVDAARELKGKRNGQIGVAVRGFIGAEYFILPKISLGGEFGWGVGFALNTKDKIKYEAEGSDGAGTQSMSEIKYKDAINGGFEFIVDTDRNAANGSQYNFIPSGTLRMNFHF